MTERRLQEGLRGLTLGLLTPFDEELNVDHDRLASNAQALSDRGAESFMAGANISEYHSLSAEELIAVAETSVTALPDEAVVVAGVGGPTNEALEVIDAYTAIPLDGLMIMPPTHTFLHEQGLLSYYRRLGTKADRAIMPYIRGFEPSVDFLTQLTKLESVVAVKYAIEDPVKLGTATANGAEDTVWINGLAEPFAPAFWAEGIDGFTAGVSNFRPDIGLALYESLRNGDLERARRIRDITVPFQRFRGQSGTNNQLPAANSVPALKMALELSGLYGGPVRDPLVELTDAGRQQVRSLYEELDEAAAQML